MSAVTPARDPQQRDTRHRDPRLDRSRTAILDAATELLLQGDIGQVTIEAITARSGVARSTLYRHFPTITEVLAAAFQRTLPPLAAPPEGTPAQRLLALVREQAAQIDNAPSSTAMIWMVAASARLGGGESAQLSTLWERVIERCRAPFDPLLRDCLGDEVDIDVVAAQLIGPLLFNAQILRRPNSDEFCARIVSDFLANHGK
ncbi:MAG TPA: helix-turn-helix domain-containing protein [Pseudonocardiaceae bacterium]|jgi:AcrR family transcriptional regulator|nr:helix-turn-helix domain-containing protein [Pseudonocardiaceae bacterium]